MRRRSRNLDSLAWRTAAVICIAGAIGCGTPDARDAAESAATDEQSQASASAPAMFPPTPPDSQSGVLLGVSYLSGLWTHWIADTGEAVEFLASGPGLLVPRRDGFWRVEESPPHECRWVAAGPADVWPEGRDWIGIAEPGDPWGGCHGGSIQIHFIGPNYFSVHHLGSEIKGDDEDRSALYTLEPMGGPVPVETFLDAPTLERIRADATRDAERLRAAGATGLPSTSFFDEAPPPPCFWPVDSLPTGWAVQRKDMRWVLRGFYEGPHGCPVIPETHVLAPPEIVGPNQLFPDRREVERALSGEWDAVSSPRRNLVIAISGGALVALRVANGTIDGEPLAIPVPADLRRPDGRPRIVMAEWAVGRRNVQRWTTELRELLAAATERN